MLPGIAAALGFGLAFGYARPMGPMALGLALLFLALGAWRRLAPLLWLSAFFAGMVVPRPASVPEILQWQLRGLEECVGVVVDLPEPTAKKLSFTVEIPSLGVRLLAYGPQDVPVYPGQRVRLFGEYGVPTPPGWREYLERRRIVGLFWAEQVEVVEESSGGLLFWVAKAREKLCLFFSAIPERARALLSALLLGSRGLLSAEEKEAFREAGVAHLLALSGLHVGILVGGGWFLLGLFRVPRAWRYAVLIPLVGLYVLIGGLRVSLLRAAIMFGVLGIFWILWERGWVVRSWLDPLQGLALAAIVVLLIWPWSALDAAFQLSFSATFGIVLLLSFWTGSPARNRFSRAIRSVADLCAVSVCAQLGVLPFLASSFGYLAPYGLLANIVLIPWTMVLLWAGVLGLPFLVVPKTQVWAGKILGILAEPYLSVVGFIGKLPGAVITVGEKFGLWYLLAILTILILRAAQEETAFLPELWPRPRPTWPG